VDAMLPLLAPAAALLAATPTAAAPPEVDPVVLESSCGADPSWICRTVLDETSSERLAEAADIVFARPLTILVILVVAWAVNRLVRRGIKRFTTRIADPSSYERVRRLRSRTPSVFLDTGTYSVRSAARARTLALVLRSLATGAIWGIATITILGELGVNLGPLIAGAGIAGVALGFGAQSLVRDFLSGIFMLIEDQYGVGDIINVGEATGTVEAVTLRTTRLRDVNGTVWHIPNGEIKRVGNMSQQWARALLDIEVAYGTDVEQAERIIKQTADSLWHEEPWKVQILEEPEVWGVERLGADGIAIRLVVKTNPSEQFTVMRELRRRIKSAFDEAGVEIPFPQRTVWVRRGEGVDGAGDEIDPAESFSPPDPPAERRPRSRPAKKS
jgi:small conductance mechanosensitive channel